MAARTIEGGTQNINSGLKIHLDFSNKRCYSPNLMNYSIWDVGTGSIAGSSSMFGITEYSLNGAVAENIRALGTDPFGYTSSIVWSSSTIDDAYVSGNQPDGGWYSGYIAIDTRKTYRFSVWMKKNIGSFNSGTMYLGHTPQVIGAGTTWSAFKNNGYITSGTNPYFHYIEPVNAPGLGGADVWTLVAGHVWPASTVAGSIEVGSNLSNYSLATNYAHPDSGIWTTSGKIGNLRFSESAIEDNGSDWVWNQYADVVRHRAYLYYGATMSPAATASFIYPRIDVVDGFEPTMQELLQGPEPARNLAELGTGFARHQTNYSSAYKGCLINKKSKFMGFHGTMSSPFTLYSASVWFMPDSTITTASPGQALAHFSAVASDPFAIYVGDSTVYVTGDVILLAGSNGGATNARTAVANISISGGKWHNITINWEGGSYAIYLDGVRQTTTSGSQANVPLLASDGYAVIGGRFSTAYGPVGFDGKLASTMAWNRSLTQAEIDAIYRIGMAKLV